MSISVVVSSTAAGVSVSGGTAVSIEVGGGIGPAGFVVAPGTATNAFGTFQLAAGDGITISTSASQFTISSYGTAAVSSLAPVQSVAGRVGAVQLQAADVTAGTFAIARIPTISYTALANVPATFGPSAHTHSTSDVVSFTAAAAAAAPVQSVAGRQGAISLAVADVSGLAAVASSGSYTSLQHVPATFAPAAHTHGTADIVGISSSFAAASHTHDAAAISSGVLALARIPTIGYTALSGVPTTFAPQAHTHSTADVVGLTASFSQVGHTHDYAASIHTHSTADIAGYTSLPAQGGKAGPLVTDGTAASWANRFSIVDPVLVQGAGMTLSRDTAAGSITVAFAGGTSGVVVSSATPQPLGTAQAGTSGDASRADHVHLMPSAADVGAAPASHSHDYVQVLNGLTGTVSITGGAGVTVSTASSSITIAAAGSYVLPTASASVLGGVKVGSGLTITDGVLAASGGSLSGSVTIPGLGDPYYSSVALLLHLNGTGSTFVDSSPSPKTITAVGNATQSTAQPKWGAKSAAFDGSGDALTVAMPAIGTGDFAIEMWVYLLDNTASFTGLYDGRSGDTTAHPVLYIGSGVLSYYVTTANRITGPTVSANAWHHIALARSSGTTRMYLDGQQVGSPWSDSTDYLSSSAAYIGSLYNTGSVNGYIDDVRVTIGGFARGYTGSSILVPAAAFPDSADLTVPVVFA
jgi:hypothetical protein